MSLEEWTDVIDTHVHGTFRVTHAAWPHMEKQKYGRIVMVSSMSAVAGNMGQANYSAAKGAVTTLAQTLAIEGARNNIIVNAVATAGLTRMTEQFGTHVEFAPEKTALGVVYFCHEQCNDSGGFYRVEGGTVYKFRYQAAAPKHFDTDGTDGEGVLRFTFCPLAVSPAPYLPTTHPLVHSSKYPARLCHSRYRPSGSLRSPRGTHRSAIPGAREARLHPSTAPNITSGWQ
jgi:hypothetical protein